MLGLFKNSDILSEVFTKLWIQIVLSFTKVYIYSMLKSDNGKLHNVHRVHHTVSVQLENINTK